MAYLGSDLHCSSCFGKMTPEEIEVARKEEEAAMRAIEQKRIGR